MDGAYYKTRESVDEYIKLAEGYSGELLIERLREYLPDKARVLELGSGPGTDWEILNKNFEVIGSDNSSEFLRRLISDNPDGEFLELDAITLATERKFDAIYSNKVLHHLSDHELSASIKRQSEVLKAGGIICHSFWKGEGTEIFKGLFVNYHTLKNIQNFFETNFEIIAIDRYKEFEDNDSIMLIGRKKE